jgi:hypothetical protein
MCSLEEAVGRSLPLWVAAVYAATGCSLCPSVVWRSETEPGLLQSLEFWIFVDACIDLFTVGGVREDFVCHDRSSSNTFDHGLIIFTDISHGSFQSCTFRSNRRSILK